MIEEHNNDKVFTTSSADINIGEKCADKTHEGFLIE